MKNNINERIKILHNNYSKKLINYSNKIVNNLDDAEDIYQNMLIFLLENADEKIFYKNTFNITYIYKIIYSRSINFINKNNLNIEINDDITEDCEDEYDYEKDEMFEQKMNIIIKTINELSDSNYDKYIKYYVKYYLYKTPISMLAKKAKISKNTLYTHFRTIQCEVKKLCNEKLIINQEENCL